VVELPISTSISDSWVFDKVVIVRLNNTRLMFY